MIPRMYSLLKMTVRLHTWVCRDREWDGEGAHFLLHKSLDSVYPLLPDLLTSVEIYAWEVDGCLGKDLKIIFAYLASFRNLKLVTVAVWEFLDKEVVECLVAMWPSIRLECPIDVIYNYYTVMTRNPSLISADIERRQVLGLS